MWQVHLKNVSNLASPPSAAAPDCADYIPEWDEIVAPMTGHMSARTNPALPTQDVCALPPATGFQRLDNQLYRVEIFQGGATLEQSTMVWSRDNAMVETTISSIDNDQVVVTDLGKDDLHSFDANQWVEIVLPEAELQDGSRFLAQISATDAMGVSTITSQRFRLCLRRTHMGSAPSSLGHDRTFVAAGNSASVGLDGSREWCPSQFYRRQLSNRRLLADSRAHSYRRRRMASLPNPEHEPYSPTTTRKCSAVLPARHH